MTIPLPKRLGTASGAAITPPEHEGAHDTLRVHAGDTANKITN